MTTLTFKLGPIAVCVAVATIDELQESIRRGRLGAGVGARNQSPSAQSTKGGPR